MKKILSLSLFLLLALYAVADVYTIGTGTSASSTVPYYGLYNYGWSKVIYTQAELSTAGMTSAVSIQGLGFYIGNTPADYVMNDQKVYARHTATALYETTDISYPGLTDFTLLFQGTLTYNGGGWYYITFTTPFAWNGTGNIEFLFENWDTDNPTGYPTFRYTSTSPDFRAVYKGDDTAFPSTLTGTRTTSRPNVQIITPQTTVPNPADVVFPLNAATQVSPTAVLRWAPVNGFPNGYRLSLGTNNPPTNMLNNVDVQNITSYNPDPDLQISTTYYWKVVPYNQFGDAVNCPVWSFTTHGDATITQLPYTNNFDSITVPDLPFDWLSYVDGAGAVVVSYASSPNSAPNCIRIYNGTVATNEALLITPQLAQTIPASSVRMKLWVKGGGTGYALNFGVMTDPADLTTFTQVGSISPTTAWAEYVVPFNSYTGNGRYLAIRHGQGGTGRTFYIDDTTLELIATNDLACTALSGNTTPSVGTPTTYNASIFNWGTAAQTNYTVKLFDGNNVELGTSAGVNCAPGTTVQVPFTWTPQVEGTTTLYAKVFLTGDQNATNDQSPNLNILVMGTGTLVVSIGDGTAVNTTSGTPTPYGTYYKNFHQQYLFTAAEILAAGGAPGLISALSFNVQAVNNCSPMPNYTIKLKNTQQTVLTTTFEVGDYTQVWFQDNFLPVVGWNTHPFTTPFMWDGVSNLLVDIITTMIPTSYTQNASVYYTPTTGVNTSLRYQSDSVDASTSATGTVSVNRANIRFSLNIQGMGALQGTVTSSGTPISGATVTVIGTTHTAQTNAQGQYSFPFVQPGNYNVTASQIGYETLTLPATIAVDQTTTLNFNLVSSSTVTVSGTVYGSDQPTVGLAGVQVTLDGMLDYTGTTNASGQFSIAGVLSGNTYNYLLQKTGYQDLTGSITLGATNYNMGSLIMNEIALPPVQVQATENAAQTQVTLTWRPPGATGGGLVEDFETANGGWVQTSNWTNPQGDWQWSNTYNVANYTDIDTYTDTPPATAHSGTGMWGTVLQGGYTNCGGWSYLKKTFNLAGQTNPVLDFWHYMNGYNTWDYGLIKVNGNTVWGTSASAVFMPWQRLIIDLSAYANQAAVEISFEWYATTTVSYAGWYIDDLYVGPPMGRTVNYVHTPGPQVQPVGLEEEGAKLAMRNADKNSPQSLMSYSGTREPDRILNGYKVWRLTQGNENNEATWTLLTANAIQDTFYVDSAWASLPNGNYKWAVKGVYTNGVLSVPAISNMIRILRLDLSALSITGSSTPSVGMASNYTVVVKNTGTTTQQGTAYTVKLMAGATQLASVPGVTLPPDQTNSFVIPWTPTTAGPMAITGKVVLPNDAVPANDETAPLNISVMPAGVYTVTVGDGSQVEGRPLDFYYKNSLFQCMYYPSELGTFGSINALSFYNTFVTNLPNKPTKIWLGQTDLADLSGGWILPPNLTLVYDGTINYPNGENTVTIPLQTPFSYTSGNLVLYANRPWEDVLYNTADDFRVQTIGTNRARKLVSSTTTYDPAAPSAAGTLSGQFPKTTFHMVATDTTPLFAINPSAVNFGTVLINSTHTRQFTISNAGGAPLVISSISVSGSPAYTLQNVPTLPLTVNFGVPASFTLQFAPTTAGVHNGTITIVDNMARQTHTITLTANCINTTITTLPYFQNFDAATPPDLPVDWTKIVQSTVTAANVDTYASTTYAHSQPNCIRLQNSTDAAAIVMLVAPPLASTINANTTRIKFWGRSGAAAGYPLSVGVMTNYQDPSTFVEIQSLNVTSTYEDFVVTFAAYTGTGRVIAFKHGLGGTSRTFYLDDIMIEAIPDNDLAALTITGNSTPSVGMPTTYTIDVFNWGTNPQSTYQVKLYGPGNTELASAAGVQVNPGMTAQVPITWTPTTEGSISIYGKVVLTGDQNPLNDQTNPLNILVQPAGIMAFTVGDGNQTARIPIDMFYKNSLHQYLIYPAELGNIMGQITGMALYNQFTQDLMNMPINVWIGTTALADLSAGWIPVSGHSQVFSGTLNFPTGSNTITIPFNNPFMYLDGLNIVLTFERVLDTQYYGSTNYFKAQTGTPATRARNIYSDSVDYDPMAPPATGGTNTGQFAQTTFYIIPGGVGHLNGTVTGAGNQPLQGAIVQFTTGGYGTTTNAQGQYSIQNILPNTYTVNFSAYGHINQSQTITIDEDETEILNVAMQPMPTVNVTGTVVASDTGAGLSGAAIHLVGYANYDANTNAAGAFTIPGVYANQPYAYVIMRPGYSSVSGNIIVTGTNHNMGTITMNEVAYAPHTVVAVEAVNGTSVDLTWQSPDPNAIEVTEGFESETFPPQGWNQTITNTGPVNTSGVYPTWCRVGSITISGSPVNPTEGSYQAGLWWDYAHQDEWLITPAFNCPPSGYLNFDSYVFLGSTNQDHYYVKVSTDNGNNWTVLWDASAQAGGWNYYASPITVDLAQYSGQQIKLAFNASDGPGNDGLWYVWFIDDIYIGNALLPLGHPDGVILFDIDQMQTRSAGGSGFQLSPVPTTLPSRRMQEGGIRTEPSLPLPHQVRATGSTDRSLTGYKVWRLAAGQEANENSWTLLTPTQITGLSLSDPGWQMLPNGNYRWAVKALYTAGVTSVPSFSNVLQKIVQTGLISGVVRRQNTTPIMGATVTANGVSATTNSAGAYTLIIPVGTYSVTASATGFVTQTIQNVVVNLNQTTTVNFVMVEGSASPDDVAPVTATALNGNYPNPFNPETVISYSIKDAGPVRLDIYNLKGQLVQTLVNADQATGHYQIVWNGKDYSGRTCSSGVYYYKLSAPGYQHTRKMVLSQ